MPTRKLDPSAAKGVEANNQLQKKQPMQIMKKVMGAAGQIKNSVSPRKKNKIVL